MTSNASGTPKLAFSIKETAAASTLSVSTIYNHIAAGRLRVTRVGGRTLVSADALRALINGEV